MIMATGSFEGRMPTIRPFGAMFTLEYLLASDWYRRRLATKQQKDIAFWRRRLAYLDVCGQQGEAYSDLDLPARRVYAAAELGRVSSGAYLESLVGRWGPTRCGELEVSLFGFTSRRR